MPFARGTAAVPSQAPRVAFRLEMTSVLLPAGLPQPRRKKHKHAHLLGFSVTGSQDKQKLVVDIV